LAAAAAKPVFGEWGYILTIFLTIITTVSGVIASIYSASRVLGMLSQMKPVPKLNRVKSLKTLDYFLRFL
jgi:amino acid transporter